MTRAALLVLAGCGTDAAELPRPSAGGPFVVVEKLHVERHIAIDSAALAAFAAGDDPPVFRLEMTVFVDGAIDGIFRRDHDQGVWLSSSPSPGVIVDDSPSIEPVCDGCHADFAEERGMFTLAAVRAAAARDQTARITCPEEGTTPCEVSVYRDLAF